jgi:hypothetical protein
MRLVRLQLQLRGLLLLLRLAALGLVAAVGRREAMGLWLLSLQLPAAVSLVASPASLVGLSRRSEPLEISSAGFASGGGQQLTTDQDRAAASGAIKGASEELASVPPEEFVSVPASPLILTAAFERSQSSGLPPPASPIPAMQPPGRTTRARARSDPEVARQVGAGLASGLASTGGHAAAP